MRRTAPILLPIGALLLSACTGAAPVAETWTTAPPASVEPGRSTALAVTVYKSPSCDCCHEWEGYLREQGFAVESIPTDDLAGVMAEHGVPAEAGSCHTALIDGYVVEGHVPVDAIRDLLARRPPIDGIALPGMPPGSPGMPGQKDGPFEILAFDEGTTSAFGSY